MNRKILPVLLLLFLLAGLTACTDKAFGQKASSAADVRSAVLSSVSPSASASALPSDSAVGHSGASSRKSASSQNEELKKILNNLNSIGESADNLDKADSSDLVIPGN